MIPRAKISLRALTWVRRLMLWTSLVGLFASTYLLIVYVTGGPILCTTGGGCETVRASHWAFIYGIPRPALGVVFYLAVVILLVIRLAFIPKARRALYATFMWFVVFAGFAESVYLFFIQWLSIKAFCFWCLTSGAAASILFILEFFDAPEEPDGAAIVNELKFIFVSLIVAVVVGIFGLAGLLGHGVNGSFPFFSQG